MLTFSNSNKSLLFNGFRTRIAASLVFIALAFAISASAASSDLDTSFGTQGRLIKDFFIFPPFEIILDSAVQPDGKIVLVGSAGWTQNGGGAYSTIIRLNPDGSADPTFGAQRSGIAGIDIVDGLEQLTSVKVLSDGRIVAGGYGRSASTSANVTYVVRLDANGIQETGGASAILTARSPRDTIVDLATERVDGQEKIVVAGTTGGDLSENFLVTRLNADGAVDTTFGANGRTILNISILSDIAAAVAVGNFGGEEKIVVVGQTLTVLPDGNTNEDVAVVRLNANGSPDTTFDTDGVVVTDFFRKRETPRAVTVQYINNEAHTIVGGSIFQNNTDDFLLVRYRQNGAIDTTYGFGGSNNIPMGQFGDRVFDVKVTPDNKILALGETENTSGGTMDYVLFKSNTNGSSDNTFGTGGGRLVVSVGAGNDYARSLNVQPDGKYLIAGYSDDAASMNTSMFRLMGGPAPAIQRAAPFDFDGDRKSDVAVFRPSTGTWYALQSSNNQMAAVNFGTVGDYLAPADYDGDGRTDQAVFRDGTWYVLKSSSATATVLGFGLAGDIPSQADFNGDGKADISVFRPSNGTWYRLETPNNQFAAVQFGLAGDVPAAADYDGDSKADVAVFRPSTGVWYVLRSSNAQFSAVQFGLNGDRPQIGDYDGDGKADPAVFRPSDATWYVLRSSLGFGAVQFGFGNDDPAVGDYDGDGKTDIAVFRHGNGVWYILNSSTNLPRVTQWGLSSDIPARNMRALIP